jgi:hypothetical protein
VEADLQTLLTTPWTHERTRLIELLDLARGMSTAVRADLSQALADARPQTASALWLGDMLRRPEFDPLELTATVASLEWAERQSLQLTAASVVGIVSLGESTRACVAALAEIRAELPVVRAPSAIIARGVDDLGVISEVGDPATADRCIVPVGGWTEEVRWTSRAGAELLRSRPADSIVLEDPCRRLRSWSLERWRPPAWLDAVDRPGGAVDQGH